LSQIGDLPEKVDSIPQDQFNKKFVQALNKEYKIIIQKNEPDSLLLFHIIPDLYISGYYAIIFWKKGKNTYSKAVYQNNFPNGEVAKKEIYNDTLNSINIKYYLENFIKKSIRTRDLTISHINTIYDQFYFDKRKKAYLGYANNVYNLFPKDFHLAFINELLKTN
jgi:hypothetical protein